VLLAPSVFVAPNELHMATFVHNICSEVLERTNLTVELDEHCVLHRLRSGLWVHSVSD